MKCPICGEEASMPTVDIGVGEQQCGPAYCESCQWIQPEYQEGYLDDFQEYET